MESEDKYDMFSKAMIGNVYSFMIKDLGLQEEYDKFVKDYYSGQWKRCS